MARATKLAGEASKPNDQASQLISSAAQHVLAQGMGDMSLRSIAAQLNTSHRMLIYYFKSADRFWELVLREIRHIEQAQRPILSIEGIGIAKAIETAWARFSSDSYLPIIQLLFEIYPRAMRDREKYKEFLDDVVDSWLRPLEQLFARELDLGRREAALRARIELATMRGLMLDLLTTGNRKDTNAAMKYFARMIALPPLLPTPVES
ncbi:MAG: TetR/AcrR family transcriptional regulator [Polaromonas sp.]